MTSTSRAKLAALVVARVGEVRHDRDVPRAELRVVAVPREGGVTEEKGVKLSLVHPLFHTKFY